MVGQFSSERLGEAVARAHQHWYSTHPGSERQTGAPERPPLTIALSREAGTNASAVAQAVGARLDWPVYDQELLELIAGRLGLQTKLVESVDEKRGSWLQESLAALGRERIVSEPAYVHQLLLTLLSLAGHGRCVIVGRGAAQALPADTTLRVRLVAPEEGRVRAAEERLGMSHADAVRWVRQTDSDRADFVRTHFRIDPGDPRSYDLVLNTAHFATADCAELIVAAARCRTGHGRQRELATAGQRGE
jgi:hypothetical protein